MRLGRRRHSPRRATPRRRVGGDGPPVGLVVGLHGYGSDERQLDTLVPLTVPVVTVQLRAPHVVDPGFGWWLPEPGRGGAVELAPDAGVGDAVGRVVEAVSAAQQHDRIGPERTVLVGYSQGATLALSVAARHPDSFAAVVAGAGFLLAGESVRSRAHPLDVLVMNGTLDPVIDERAHRDTVERFARAGHRVSERRDPVPHVIDRAQVPIVNAFVAASLGVR